MLYKTVVFSDAPVTKGYRYRDKFQLVPFFYCESAPYSEFAKHIPVFLEYEVECIEENSPVIKELELKGLDQESLNSIRNIPCQERVKNEILQLLTCLTNYRFFSYNSSDALWGVQVPSKLQKDISQEELEELDTASSRWTFGAYLFPDLKNYLKIEKFTQLREYYCLNDSSENYFISNPTVELNPNISFPRFLDFCLDRYFSDSKTYKKTKHCIGLLYDGIELFERKRSVSLLAIFSSIEGMARLDNYLYGEKNTKSQERFLRYLKIYVAGKSENKFKTYYKKRCSITHESNLFVGDLDMYSNIDEQHKDWFLRLEIMQAARLAMYNWLRRKE